MVNKDEKITYYLRILEDQSLNQDDKQKIVEDDFLQFGQVFREVLIAAGILPSVQTAKIPKKRSRDRPNFLVYIKKDGDKKYFFNKVFKEFNDLLLTNKLSKNARSFIGTFIGSVQYPYNKILIDGEPPRIEDIIKISGMSENVLFEALAELEKFEIIKRIRKNGIYSIYFNPFLVCGEGVTVSTFVLFKESLYNVYRRTDD
jgi:hypothetical protein